MIKRKKWPRKEISEVIGVEFDFGVINHVEHITIDHRKDRVPHSSDHIQHQIPIFTPKVDHGSDLAKLLNIVIIILHCSSSLRKFVVIDN